jgi:transmembrane sensor
MDNQTQAEIENLIWNDSFRQWVLTPSPELDAYWNQYWQENPHLLPLSTQAREVVLALRVQHRPISEQEIQQLVRQTRQRIEPQLEEEAAWEEPAPSISWYRRHWFAVAASVLLLMALGSNLYIFYHKNYQSEQMTYEKLIHLEKAILVETVNNTGQPLRFRLADGSWVTLQDKSRLSYDSTFSEPGRKVFLSGEGFFEVVKDPSRPFLVYANELVTKVLGTSFTVKAYDNERDVSVEVKTGKVSVYAGSNLQMKAKEAQRELEGVVLTPNQRIVFSRREVRMVKLLVEEPLIISPKPVKFTFEDAPISEVFAKLEKAYSIDIVYDEELMRQCPLTASLNNESLFEKLDIICKAVEAKYEVIDGQIVIDSRGCKVN